MLDSQLIQRVAARSSQPSPFNALQREVSVVKLRDAHIWIGASFVFRKPVDPEANNE